MNCNSPFISDFIKLCQYFNVFVCMHVCTHVCIYVSLAKNKLSYMDSYFLNLAKFYE